MARPSASTARSASVTRSQQLYGLNFKEVKKLDAGGSITNPALDDGTIEVGLLFTGSSVIKPDYVLLEDDKGLQPADNPIALVSKAEGDAGGGSDPRVGQREARLGRLQRDGAQGLQRQGRPGDVVTDWLKDEGLTK